MAWQYYLDYLQKPWMHPEAAELERWLSLPEAGQDRAEDGMAPDARTGGNGCGAEGESDPGPEGRLL